MILNAPITGAIIKYLHSPVTENTITISIAANQKVRQTIHFNRMYLSNFSKKFVGVRANKK